MKTALLVLGATCVLGPVAADATLWDNGEPDMRNAVIAPTIDEGGPKRALITQIADDFQCKSWWEVTGVSLQGLFGGIWVGHDDPEAVGKSNRVEVRIYKPDEDGKPGELFWSTKLEGQEAHACQTLTGEIVRLGKKTFREAEEPGAATDSKLVQFHVAGPEPLVTLPPGRWFLSWEVLASINDFPLYCLTAPYPCPGFGSDVTALRAGGTPELIERKGISFLWRPIKVRYEHDYNLPFKIFGEELDGPP